jgi:hypothetical protein
MIRKALPGLLAALSACSSPDLPAPANFTAIFGETTGIFSWDPVPGATGYAVEVDLRRPLQTLTTRDTRIAIQWTSGASSLSFRVRAQTDDGVRGAFSASLGQPATIPHLSLGIDGRDATLTWGVPGDRVQIGRGPAVDSLSLVAETRGAQFVDRTLPFNTALYWRVILLSPPISLMSEAVTGTVAPAPPSAIHVAYDPPFVKVTWDPIDGARGYSVRSTSDEASTTALLATPEIGPFNCGPGPACTYEIAPISASGAPGLFSQPFRVTTPPSQPGSPAFRPAAGRVILSLPPLPLNADHFAVLRAQSSSFDPVGDATGREFADRSISPWTRYSYEVQAVTSDGVTSRPSQAVVGAFGTSGATPMNSPATGLVPVNRSIGNAFTVPVGGRLMAVEADAEALFFAPRFTLTAGGRLLASGVTPISPTLPGDPADVLHGAVLDLSAEGGLPVSAGETLILTIESRDSNSLQVPAGTFSGGTLFQDGSPAGAGDLAFTLFIADDPAFLPPASFAATPALGGVKLQWDASPAAARYEIYRASAPGAPFDLIATTQDTSYVDHGLSAGDWQYKVDAVSAAGDRAESSVIAAGPLPDRAVAANLGDTAPSAPGLCAGLRSQSFTAGASGLLSGVEIRLEQDFPQNLVTLDVVVSDGKGIRLGTGSQDVLGSDPAALDPDVPGAVIDFSSLGIPIVAGETYSILVGVRSCNANLRTTADVYDGGEEFIDGVPHPEADLTFRVLVR